MITRYVMAKGFNKGQQMGGGGMMAQIQKMQQQLAEAQEKLAVETVTATAGGGAIKVVMTGDQKCQSVEINPDLMNDAHALSAVLSDFKANTSLCQESVNSTEAGRERCEVCESSQRDGSMVCVVEEALDVLALERTGGFQGK